MEFKCPFVVILLPRHTRVLLSMQLRYWKASPVHHSLWSPPEMVSDQKYPKENNIREHVLAFIEGKSKQMIIQIISRQCFVYGRKLDHAWEFLQLSLVTCVAACCALFGWEGVAFEFFLHLSWFSEEFLLMHHSGPLGMSLDFVEWIQEWFFCFSHPILMTLRSE